MGDSLTLSSRLWGTYSQVAAELTDEDNIDLPNIFLKIKSRMSNMMLRNAQHNEFDGDGDGYVDADELAKRCDISLQEAKKLITKYDTDGDGQLDVEEFEELKRQLIADREKGNETLSDRAAHAQATTVSSEEFVALREDVSEIMDLLKAVLDQTNAGKRALKKKESLRQPK